MRYIAHIVGGMMPEGKPLIPDDLVKMLERNGISLEEAEADFRAGIDAARGDSQARVGRLGVYYYRVVIVFGRADYFVTSIGLF